MQACHFLGCQTRCPMRCPDRQPIAVVLGIGVCIPRSAIRSPAQGRVPSGSNCGLQCFQKFGQLGEHVLHLLRNELSIRGNLTSSDAPVSQTPMSLVTFPHLCREHPSQDGRCDSRWPHVVVILIRSTRIGGLVLYISTTCTPLSAMQ